MSKIIFFNPHKIETSFNINYQDSDVPTENVSLNAIDTPQPFPLPGKIESIDDFDFREDLSEINQTIIVWGIKADSKLLSPDLTIVGIEIQDAHDLTDNKKQ